MKARVTANIDALHVLKNLERDSRPATADEQRTLAAWSSWGAAADVFDEAKPEWDQTRALLRTLLPDNEYLQARRTILNAHYTDPSYVAAIWDGVTQLGFTEGQVLEPGCGSGTFIGMAPAGAQMTGIELDPTTARIATALYPDSTIRAESFADTTYPSGSFDVTVGNVPFSKVTLHDPIDNSNGHSLHNHFILKSLRLTRPGGIVAVLTSRFTLDTANPGARREMYRTADLIGAVRLPTGAHRRTAGTEAVTDLLIFRRRLPGNPEGDFTWEQVTARNIDGHTMKVNAYFDRRPEHILGELQVANGMHGSTTLHVHAQLEDTARALRDAVRSVVNDGIERGYTLAPAPEREQPATVAPIDRDDWDGSIHALDDGTFTTSTRTGREPFKVPKTATAELRHLLRLRDLATHKLQLENTTVDDTDEITTTQRALHAAWERYVRTYGPINRFTPTPTGRTDEDTGEPILARRAPTAPRLLKSDPFGPLVFALEVFDDDTQTAEPAALITRRVVVPRPEKLGADNAAEAMAISLDRTGHVDLNDIASLLGTTADDAREQLGTLVFDEPDTGQLIPAAEYLSGNVITKLDTARAAADTDPRLHVNVERLQHVIPDPLTPEEISARPGAVWISPEIHEQFLRELLNDKNLTVTNPLPGEWQVRGAVRFSVRATQEWGTERRPAPDLFQSLATQSPIRVDDVTRQDGEEIRTFNPGETAAAQDKAQQLQERFEEWVWEDPERARDLAAEYNRRFNGIVLRDYSQEGTHLSLPGMAANFQPRPHQRAAVARMLSEPAVGLFHEVGAGKTAEMIIGSMELKRTGMVNKVGVVVPNHMLEQFSREWLQVYPQARILAAGSDTLRGDNRRLFVARAAANDWDAIILTRTAFKMLPVQPDTEARYMGHHLAILRAALEDPAGLDRKTIKRIESQLAKEEEKYKKLLDMPRDAGVTFEATGIDYLVVDEMHDYKNLNTTSRIQDANIVGSARATDLSVKLEYLRQKYGKRVVTAATATPIANSVTEAHVMQRYLRPDLLREAGVESFDAWAATFGQTVTDVEMAPQGGGQFRVKTRFARFRNVPEMLRMWHVFADVKTAADLNLPTPPLRERADGRRIPETVALTPSVEVRDYVESLGDRAVAVQEKRVTPEEDNMLKISTDGRKAALDIRLVDPTAQPATFPLADVADNIATIHAAHADDTYLDTRTNEPSPATGALQLVFCDLGTPHENRWNAYDELRRQLIQRGVPDEGIRFIHEAKNDKEKARLFSAAREGRVAVLIGSTTKMGVGTNVQARAIALHDVDCPWRPADVAQRHGRILRQGNQNPEVAIYQYVVESTFAAYMWQAIERKSKFIDQVMRGSLDVREINEVGSDTLSAAEAKALASGNPLLLERSVALNETARLERLERAWHRNQRTLRASIDAAERNTDRARADIAALTQAQHKAVDLSGDRFRMTINGTDYTSRSDAAAALARWGNSRHLQYARPIIDDRPRGPVGAISGFTITGRTASDFGNVSLVLELDGVPGARVHVPVPKLIQGEIGMIRSLEHRVSTIDELISKAQHLLDEAQQARLDAERSLGAPFKHRDALNDARAELERVDAQLAKLTQDPDEPEPSADTTPAPVAASSPPPPPAVFLPPTTSGPSLN